MSNKTITVEAVVDAPIDVVWQAYNDPEQIKKWAFASDDWGAPKAENDLRVGGKFYTRMQAKDGSAGFDFGGHYTKVVLPELIEYNMDDAGNRHVVITFSPTQGGVKVSVTFEIEHENPEEMQRSGWQAILNNFKSYTEGVIE